MKRVGPYLAAAALFAAAAFFIFRAHEGERAPGVAPGAARPTAGAVTPAATAPAPPPEAAPLPPALRDTEVDGELATDANGNLVVSPDVRRFFDYFLVASGDLAPEALRARIAAEIRKRLPAQAAAQAVDLLDRYLEYRRRAAALDDSGSPDYEARLTALWALRREVIGTRDAAALFGDDEQSTRAALERQRIETDPRLTDAEKEEKLEALEAELPEGERKARADAVSALRLFQDEQALRDRGASPDEIRRLREERVGPEAADRLEELDQQRAAFATTLDQARAVKGTLDANAEMTPVERDAALATWIGDHFPPEERLHAKSLLGLPLAAN